MNRTNFIHANLSRQDLREFDFSGLDLNGARFCEAKLQGANLSGCDARGADFTGANLTDAILKGCRYDEETMWPKGFDPKAHGARLLPGRDDYGGEGGSSHPCADTHQRNAQFVVQPD